jgi:hypothetical protein
VCKYFVKVFKMLNPEINDTMIIWHARTLRGTIAGGFDVLSIDSFKSGTLVEEGEKKVDTEEGT